MNILRMVAILAIAEIFCLYWDALFKYLEMSNLVTQMLTFIIVDLLTIKVIAHYPIRLLTKYITIILYLSIITHVFGAYCWTSYNTCVDTYDISKDWIFNLELMVFIIYGIYSGGKRLRAMVVPAGMDDMVGNPGDNTDHQITEKRR